MEPAEARVAELKKRATLHRDVQRMVAVGRAGADEATIFYAARIVEITCNLVLAKVGIRPTNNLFESLTCLQNYNLIPPLTRCWAHTVRRLGNDVRHIRQQICHDSARLSCMMVARILTWSQPWLDPMLPTDGKCERLTSEIPIENDIAHILETCELTSSEPSLERLDQYLAHPSQLDADGSILAAMIETFVERDVGWLPLVERRIAGCSWINRSLRLQQLLVLILSRQGKLDQANCLGKSLIKNSPDDEESIGIVAGVYKRRWQLQDSEVELLHRANRLYRSGWRASKHRIMYLGINAAATNVWLSQFDAARSIAEKISEVLFQRAMELSQADTSQPLQLCLWDTLSLAESLLIQGNVDDARRYYRLAASQHPNASVALAVARSQAARLLHKIRPDLPIEHDFY